MTEEPGEGPSGRRRPAPALLAVLLAAALVVAGAGYLFWSGRAIEETAPDFTLTSTGYEDFEMGDRVLFNLSDHRGQTVVLDFMAVACTSCRIVTEEILKPLHERYGERDDFVILAVNTWADPEGPGWVPGETVERTIEQQKKDGVPWRHALDTDGVWQKYSAWALPKTVVVSPEGRIVFEATGVPSLNRVDTAVQAALAGDAEPVPVLRLGLFGIALVAGLASFFAPCSVGLVPAYLGLLLQGNRNAPPAMQATRIVGGGLVAAAGVVAMYALITLMLWPFGGFLQNHIAKVGPVMGLLLVGVGLTMLIQRGWDRVAALLGKGHLDGRKGFFAFGLGYGLAAFACTGPAILPAIFLAFSEGPATALGVLALYAGAVASFMVLAAGLVASGRTGPLRNLLSRTQLVTRVSAIMLILGGLVVLWYYSRALAPGLVPF